MKTGKTFTWPTLLRDHTRFAAMLPGYLAADVVPGYALAPVQREGVLLTVNSINTCPYCTGLHGQLARMAGMTKTDENDPAVVYAKVFATEAGRGKDVDAAYERLAGEIGAAHAMSVRSLCWALLWGKTTGNTINAARDKIKSWEFGSLSLLDLFVLGYYGPLFAVIAVLNAILVKSPKIPAAASAGLGAILWVPQALNILPLGIISIVYHLGIV